MCIATCCRSLWGQCFWGKEWFGLLLYQFWDLLRFLTTGWPRIEQLLLVCPSLVWDLRIWKKGLDGGRKQMGLSNAFLWGFLYDHNWCCTIICPMLFLKYFLGPLCLCSWKVAATKEDGIWDCALSQGSITRSWNSPFMHSHNKSSNDFDLLLWRHSHWGRLFWQVLILGNILGVGSCWNPTRCVPTDKPTTRLVRLFGPQKINNIFYSEVLFVLPSLVAPLSWQDDGIRGQTNIPLDPPFHVDHGDAIY